MNSTVFHFHQPNFVFILSIEFIKIFFYFEIIFENPRYNNLFVIIDSFDTQNPFLSFCHRENTLIIYNSLKYP